eukprot:scaffold379_cov145-Skeletonema_menzelii.AAC.3
MVTMNQPPTRSILLLPIFSFLATSFFLPLRVSSLSSFSPPPSPKNYDMRITSLHRYAVKGLSGECIESVTLQEGDGTFQDDRRFALLYAGNNSNFDQSHPQWLHKDNFLCAFTAPDLLATLRTEYQVEAGDGRRLLTVWSRHGNSNRQASSTPLLVADLACQAGRDETSDFFSELCGKKVICVCANASNVVTPSSTSQNDHDGNSDSGNSQLNQKHTHQFGNTSSGVKNNNGDTRTIHIVNSNTVKQFSNVIQHELEQQYNEGVGGRDNGFDSIQLNPTRFRPNVVVDGLEPWLEFDLIGKTIEVVPHQDNDGEEDQSKPTPLRFRITARTVRCAGIGVDPLQPELGILDVPKLLTKHFPQHGPYLGVYAVVDGSSGGNICVGDTFRVVDE